MRKINIVNMGLKGLGNSSVNEAAASSVTAPQGTRSMKQTTIHSIRQQIEQLSTEDQLILIEQIAKQLRRTRKRASGFRATDLAEMAADPDVQREIRLIDEEFRTTEMDGLENH
jgi:hypothetical protein